MSFLLEFISQFIIEFVFESIILETYKFVCMMLRKLKALVNNFELYLIRHL